MPSLFPNPFNKENDSFAGAVTNVEEQTKLGSFMSIVILPICVMLYSIIYFVQFYYGFAGSEPLYKVTSTETISYATNVFPLTLKCQNPDGCYYRMPAGGADMCASGTLSTETESSDLCAASGRRRTLLDVDAAVFNASAREFESTEFESSSASIIKNRGRALLQGSITPAACSSLIACNVELSTAAAVCAYQPTTGDPIDGLTVYWKHDWTVSPKTCTGACTFGVSIMSDYLSNVDNTIKQRELKVHRGKVLLSLVIRDDPKMEWDPTHPDYATRKSETMIYEWGITPVDTDGLFYNSPDRHATGSGSNLCKDSMATSFGTASVTQAYTSVSYTVPKGAGVALTPFPLYSKVTTSYPQPFFAYLAAAGGIAATISGIMAYIHTAQLKAMEKLGVCKDKEDAENKPANDEEAAPTGPLAFLQPAPAAENKKGGRTRT